MRKIEETDTESGSTAIFIYCRILILEGRDDHRDHEKTSSNHDHSRFAAYHSVSASV